MRPDSGLMDVEEEEEEEEKLVVVVMMLVVSITEVMQ